MSDSIGDFFRPGSRIAEAVPAFTNRVAEIAAFDRAIEQHARWRTSIDPLDADAARLNILNFYGIGGIGKSSLLRALKQRLAASDSKSANAIIDFQETTSYDLEDLIMRLRTTVGELGVKCVAFDFALSFYWSVAHPGVSLEAYTKSNSVLHRVADKIGFSAEVESSVVEVVSSVLSASAMAHGATRLAQTVARLVKDRSNVKHAIGGCRALPLFLDSETVEQTLSYMPALLAWDLAQAGNPEVVFLLDTYEELTKRGRQSERIVQRMCFLLPNALFVVAGRNRLDWTDAHLSGSLDYVGAKTWPDLGGGQTTERCVLLGDLSPIDADRYLRNRLVQDGQPAIPEAIRSQIVTASAGWPLHLEIAATQYQQALAQGTVADVDFSAGFPALVTRLASDLTVEERRVLRGASMLTAFDDELLRAAAGDVSHAVVGRVMARNFVKRDEDAVWKFSLHPALRDALRIDTAHEDAWSPADWSAAAGRVLQALRDRAAATTSVAELGACVVQALSLAHEYGLGATWLSQAGRRLAAENAVGRIHALGDDSTHAGALSTLLEAVGRSANLPFSETAELLEQSLSDRLTPADLFWARSLQASAFLSFGDLKQAERIYREVLDAPPEGEDVYDTQTMFSLTLLKKGGFTELENFARENQHRVDAHRLLGDVYRCNALWLPARENYLLGLRRAEERKDSGLIQLFRSELALVDGWTGESDPAKWDVPDLPRVGIWTEVSQLIAQALFASTRDEAQATRLLDGAEAIAENFGLHEGLSDVLIARGFLAALYGEDERLLAAAAALEERVDHSGTYASWLAVLQLWAGRDLDDRSTDVHWLGGPTAAAAGWTALLSRRIAEIH